MRPFSKFAIRKASLAIDDGRALRKYFRGAIQEVRRVQWSYILQGHLPAPLKSGFKVTLTRDSHVHLRFLVAQAFACGIFVIAKTKTHRRKPAPLKIHT